MMGNEDDQKRRQVDGCDDCVPVITHRSIDTLVAGYTRTVTLVADCNTGGGLV